jgi:hypothetical protein
MAVGPCQRSHSQVRVPRDSWPHFTVCRVDSYVTTDGQSASLSWNKAPVWGLRPDFCYCQTVADVLMWDTLSLMRGRVCRLQLLLALASAVILGSESRGTRDHILLSQIRNFPFFRLLQLAGIRWRYWTLTPHHTKFSSYFTGNTSRRRYKAQPFIPAVWRNSRCLLWEPYGTHKYIF